jgi:mRNA interferase HigB
LRHDGRGAPNILELAYQFIDEPRSELFRNAPTVLTYRKLRLSLAATAVMRVISRRRLREFWQSRKHDAGIAEKTCSAWFKLAKNADWPNLAAVRQTFASADRVGNCIVFDVGNNRFRLIARLNFRREIVYVLRIMDHAEYDRERWIQECGCHRPPPQRKSRPDSGS